ncbi:beta-galactosidase [Parapedobacter sp. DT-150]|uniref:beta-galactosidase n=1 Tax=Parapedobacter sp. DT-150 TaxID=3396162 RepID=UPI003F53FE4D
MKNIFYCFLAWLFVGCIANQKAAQGDDLRLAPVGDMPILAWYSIPPEETSPARFRELKETGMNQSYTPYPDADAVQKALDAAQEAGVKIAISCPELYTETEATVKRFMKHPALAGYHLVDEPNTAAFADLGAWTRKIQELDDAHYCYINLLPNYASLDGLKASSYREYVRRYIEEVPTQILSFDHYPVVETEDGYALRPSYYENLEIFSDEAKKAGRPFWAFSLTVAHEPYPIPDIAQMRLQQFSNLAYGAQGLQYFTYWTPGKNDAWNFHHGPIGLDGKRTDVYDELKALNQEIKALTPVFLGAEVRTVRHTGHHIPLHTTRLSVLSAKVTRLEILDTIDNAREGREWPSAGAIVSELQNGRHRYLVIVNRDFQQRLALGLAFESGVKKVLKDGRLVPASRFSEEQLVAPGDMLVYQLE